MRNDVRYSVNFWGRDARLLDTDIDDFVDQIIELREERDRVVEVFEKELEEYLDREDK